MKPKEKKSEEVYRIINRETGATEGAYSRAYCTEYDFTSPQEARNANCNGEYKNRAKYGIARYRVTYELIDDDVDPPDLGEVEKHLQDKADREEAEKLLEESGITGVFEQMAFLMNTVMKIRARRRYEDLAKLFCDKNP